MAPTYQPYWNPLSPSLPRLFRKYSLDLKVGSNNWRFILNILFFELLFFQYSLLFKRILFYFILLAKGHGSCPLQSSVRTCFPRCLSDFECMGYKRCCRNVCGTMSCSDTSPVYAGNEPSDNSKASKIDLTKNFWTINNLEKFWVCGIPTNYNLFFLFSYRTNWGDVWQCEVSARAKMYLREFNEKTSMCVKMTFYESSLSKKFYNRLWRTNFVTFIPLWILYF